MADAVIDKSLYKDRQPSVIKLKGDSTVTWAIPAALTEFGAATSTRLRVDLSRFKEARIGANVTTAADANSELRIQYSFDGTTWRYLDEKEGPRVTVDSTGVRLGSWVQIGALDNSNWDDVHLRAVGILGAATLSSAFASVWLEVR